MHHNAQKQDQRIYKVDTEWNPEVAKEIKKLEFDRRIELLTKLIVDKAKEEVDNKFGNRKRHRQ